MTDHSLPTPLTPPIRHLGTVIHGEKVGRTIGFPTANLAQTPNPESVKPGVYFGQSQVVGETTWYDCLVYFGPRYIFGEQVNSFEVFIYDFSGDMYGKELAVMLSHFQRHPEKITNLEQLQQLLERDKLVGETLRQK
jgi:riboflavin kinase/FMN adenylyltransferase